MKFKMIIAVLVVIVSGMALTQSAYAGCSGKVIRKARCKSVGLNQFDIRFEVCGSFGGPIEVFLNGSLMTTVPGVDDRPFQRKLKLVGFGPGVYKIKGVNSRGVVKVRKVTCSG